MVPTVTLLVIASFVVAVRLVCLIRGARAQLLASHAHAEQIHIQACQAEHQRAQFEAENLQLKGELERIREKRHTYATTEMLEDLSAVADDLDRELKMSFRYLTARLKNFEQILAAGRPGPYSYTPATTESRPARPGAAVKLWTR